MTMFKKVIAVTALTLVAGTALANEWKEEKNADGVQVFLKQEAGSKYKAYRGVTVINASLDKVLAVQADAANSCQWIHECSSLKVLKKEGPSVWTYTQFSTPWPVTPRDSVLKVTESKQGDEVVRKIEGLPSYQPETKGYVRVAKVDGYWKFKPLSANQTQVTYEVHTDPGGSVPAWLANKFVVEAPFNTLAGMRNAAQK
ncbi:START domain-containing protein [Thiopseudomonas alkaliphila]|uniref:START domain-containing protein n=1 Tax=Thiopseudomonas alkaliphila TaxID=1697053 RepID=UPI0039DFD118